MNEYDKKMISYSEAIDMVSKAINLTITKEEKENFM